MKKVSTLAHEKVKSWQSVGARIVAGHGVASGRCATSPYPKGSIALQMPFFEEHGVDLTECFQGTLNLSIAPGVFEMHCPEVTVYDVNWTDHIPPEHFSFAPCRLRVADQIVNGWIYYPRPETKTIHFQPAHLVEVIAPKIDGLAPGDTLTLEYSNDQARVIREQERVPSSVQERKEQKGSAPSKNMSPTSPWIVGLLLLCLVFTGCVSEIIGSNLQADPKKRVDVGLDAATQYLKAGDVENSLRHIRKVLELEPKNAEAHQTMALIYTKEGNTEKAEKYYKKAIRYDKKSSSTRNNYATLLYSQGRYEEAVKQLLVATSDLEYDNRARAVQNLGLAYIKLGELSKAESSFQTAVRLNPKLAQSYLELSDILWQQKQHRLAARYLRDYASLARHSPRSLLLGIQIEQVNGNQDAIASYALALRNLYPNSEEYQLYMETKK